MQTQKITVRILLKERMEKIRKKRGQSQSEYIDSLIRKDKDK